MTTNQMSRSTPALVQRRAVSRLRLIDAAAPSNSGLPNMSESGSRTGQTDSRPPIPPCCRCSCLSFNSGSSWGATLNQLRLAQLSVALDNPAAHLTPAEAMAMVGG